MSEMKMLTTPCVCTSCIYKLAPDTFKHPENVYWIRIVSLVIV